MSAINTFKSQVLNSSVLPYICDDIFEIILTFLRMTYCRKCHKWIGEKNIKCCYLRDHTLCFVCYHKLKWPVS